MHWGWDHYPWGWSTMIVMGIFLLLLIAGIVWLITNLGTGKGSRRDETALEILKNRYARGEITKEEFEEMKRNIQ
jgi:putative membrane protein